MGVLVFAQLRGLQGILQEDRPQGPLVRVPRGEVLHHRQEAEKSVSVLQIPEVSGHGDEEGGGPGGTPAHQRKGSERGGEHEQFALGHADRAYPGGRETSRVQDGATRKLRGKWFKQKGRADSTFRPVSEFEHPGCTTRIDILNATNI